MTVEKFTKLYKAFDEVTNKNDLRDIVLKVIIDLEAEQDQREKKWDLERQGLLDTLKGM